MADGEFGGRTVLVTGGTRGIGAGIARRFLAAAADRRFALRHLTARVGAGEGSTAGVVLVGVVVVVDGGSPTVTGVPWVYESDPLVGRVEEHAEGMPQAFASVA